MQLDWSGRKLITHTTSLSGWNLSNSFILHKIKSKFLTMTRRVLHDQLFACLSNIIYNSLSLCFPVSSQSHCPYSLYTIMPLRVWCSTLGMLSLSSLHSYLLLIFQVSAHTFFSSLWPFLSTYLLSLSVLLSPISVCPNILLYFLHSACHYWT